MLSWNSRDLTVQSLRHLLDTDQGATLRVLVRDNASTDGTAETLARQVPEVELDVGDRNLGFAGGMNSLLARTTADWVLVLNSDAWPEPGAIGAMLRAGQRADEKLQADRKGERLVGLIAAERDELLGPSLPA